MLPGMELMGCQDLAVPMTVMRHVIHVESGANPYAIGVVGGRLQRQPGNLDEAVATARMLETKGHDFSLGIAQIHRANLGKYGLDTLEKAFDACANLSAGARILAGCYSSAEGNWAKAFSCYYSGNFVKGFQDGYVQKIYDSINLGMALADRGSAAIPMQPPPGRPEPTSPGTAVRNASGQDLAALRSVPLNPPAQTAVISRPLAQSTAALPPDAGAFIPQVHGPGEPPVSPRAVPVMRTDPPDPRLEVRDSAFVF